MTVSRSVRVASGLTLLCAIVFGQTVTSSLVGTLTDPANSVVPRVEVQLTHQATGAVRSAQSNSVGFFRFNNVPPGAYWVAVRAPGFKSYVQRGLSLSGSETRDLGRIVLEPGAAGEETSVTAEAAQVQTATSEKSSLVDGTQLDTLGQKGRDLFGFVGLVPGVVDTASAGRDVTSANAMDGITFGGAASKQQNFTVDGVTAVDTASTSGRSTVHYQPNMDSIAEIRVLTSNYQAEYGRNSSGAISVVTKSGGREFHGSGWWNHRHEQFNANDFFRNRTGVARAPYRYNVAGFSIGGPVYIPKAFNTQKKKLFFFVSQEYTRQKVDAGTRYTNMPSPLERQGDFSRSFDTSGKQITIKDPLTGLPFAGNTIPPSRINVIGQAILNFFPRPNYADPDPKLVYSRNFKAAGSGPEPRRNDMIRIDTNLTPKLSGYFRFVHDIDVLDQIFQAGVTWIGTIQRHPVSGKGYAAQITYTIGPTMVNEFLFGKSYNTLKWWMVDDSEVTRDKMGNPPKWYPIPTNADPLFMRDFVPAVSFGSTPVSAPSIGSIVPVCNWNNIYTISDSLSKVMSKHSLKAGIYLEHTGKIQYGSGGANYRGSFNFGRDPNNPYDSGHGFANALLGNFASYSEGQRVIMDNWFWTAEWYFQDNWRITGRLSLDLGMRFYRIRPEQDTYYTLSGFDPSSYSLRDAPRLYYPGFGPDGKRIAVDRLTGATAPVSVIGLYVPQSGQLANGMRVGGKDGYPRGMFGTPAVSPAARFGFAYDVFGNGKTAIRGGFGQSYSRVDGAEIMNMSGNPPITYSASLFYSNIDTLMQAAAFHGPTNISSISGEQHNEQSMNASLGLQQNLGFSTTLDVSYVGSWRRHGLWRYNINGIPIFARFDAANADPTNPKQPLPDNFLRPYQGFGDLNSGEFASTTNYNSLQVTARRRLSKNLMFGVTYTWSKALSVSTPSVYFPSRSRNYGPTTSDRSHVLVINYLYDLPKLGARFGSKAWSAMVDNWTVSGITSFSSGAPFTPGLTTTTNADITGSEEAARIDVLSDPRLPKGERTFYRNFKTEAFALPAVRTFGNAGVNILRGPGINNWDMTIAKKILLGVDAKRFLRFQAEFYNIWNHTQFSSYDTTARFDPIGAQANPNFGAYNAARPPRQISLSLRFQF